MISTLVSIFLWVAACVLAYVMGRIDRSRMVIRTALEMLEKLQNGDDPDEVKLIKLILLKEFTDMLEEKL